ncbi:MAG: hypothetical protein C0466_12980 [Candidatus Accumulibacter sp.]|nr:hypothetical protein [Accumulibacter sp.]
MKRLSWLAIIASALALSACGTTPGKQTQAPRAPQSGQLELALRSGTYTCEQDIRIRVEREIREGANVRIDIVWNGDGYRLERDASYSGLPRFEDAARSLVWIDLPWKSLLLDGKTNTPLVNECRFG